MNNNKLNKADLFSWITKILESENFEDYQIEVKGTSESGDGYLGDIVFVKISGVINKSEKKILNLVIKHGKINDHLRETTPVKTSFEVEIYAYNNIFPTFRKFQEEKNILSGFNSTPKYFGSLILDNMEVIVLENLKEIGYELYDRRIPLNIDHQKAVLREYGKFHALSFALRDQKREEFETLVANLPEDNFRKFLEDDSISQNTEDMVRKAKTCLHAQKDLDLYEKYRAAVGKHAGETLKELSFKTEPQFVITHGDCWNNNFMYKYKNSEKRSPSKIAILDWQIIGCHSPVFDLSYFIYATSSKAELEKFDELLKEYYSSFSSFLRQLGSDPDVLFPFSSLVDHWKKYALFGLLFIPILLPIALCEKEDAPKLEDMKTDENLGDMFKVDIKNNDHFRDRFIPALESYFNFVC